MSSNSRWINRKQIHLKHQHVAEHLWTKLNLIRSVGFIFQPDVSEPRLTLLCSTRSLLIERIQTDMFMFLILTRSDSCLQVLLNPDVFRSWSITAVKPSKQTEPSVLCCHFFFHLINKNKYEGQHVLFGLGRERSVWTAGFSVISARRWGWIRFYHLCRTHGHVWPGSRQQDYQMIQ